MTLCLSFPLLFLYIFDADLYFAFVGKILVPFRVVRSSIGRYIDRYFIDTWPTVHRYIADTLQYICCLERRTGIARSRVQTPLKSWLFQASIRNCLNCVRNCDDHSLLDTADAIAIATDCRSISRPKVIQWSVDASTSRPYSGRWSTDTRPLLDRHSVDTSTEISTVSRTTYRPLPSNEAPYKAQDPITSGFFLSICY